MMTVNWTKLLYQAPILIILLVGIVCALAFWRRAPNACLLAVIGLGILFLVGLIPPIADACCHALLRREWNWNADKYGQVMAVVGVIYIVFQTVGLAFVVLALFTGRRAGLASGPPRL